MQIGHVGRVAFSVLRTFTYGRVRIASFEAAGVPDIVGSPSVKSASSARTCSLSRSSSGPSAAYRAASDAAKRSANDGCDLEDWGPSS